MRKEADLPDLSQNPHIVQTERQIPPLPGFDPGGDQGSSRRLLIPAPGVGISGTGSGIGRGSNEVSGSRTWRRAKAQGRDTGFPDDFPTEFNAPLAPVSAGPGRRANTCNRRARGVNSCLQGADGMGDGLSVSH
jgi:hypothetical protein